MSIKGRKAVECHDDGCTVCCGNTSSFITEFPALLSLLFITCNLSIYQGIFAASYRGQQMTLYRQLRALKLEGKSQNQLLMKLNSSS